MYVRTIPTPEPEVNDTRIQSWDPIIGTILEQAASWARVGHPITDSFDAVWGIAVEMEHRHTQHSHYLDVRAQLPELPVTVNFHGDSPGGPGYLEVNFDRADEEDFRTICYADPMDGPYTTDDGRIITGHVWFTDGGSTLDIIEMEVSSVPRVVAAINFMWNKYKPVYVAPDTTGRHRSC